MNGKLGQQGNPYDCGVFLILQAEAIQLNLNHHNLTQEYINTSKAREKLAALALYYHQSEIYKFDCKVEAKPANAKQTLLRTNDNDILPQMKDLTKKSFLSLNFDQKLKRQTNDNANSISDMNLITKPSNKWNERKTKAAEYAFEFLETQHRADVAREENETNNNFGDMDNNKKGNPYYYCLSDSEESNVY